VRTVIVAAGAALLLAACSSSGSAGTASQVRHTDAPAGDTTPSTVSCPAAPPGQAWPKQAPQGLPVPAGLKINNVQTRPNTVIRFTVPDDFHATVKYLLDALPKTGFTLGTGDSEAEEADIPFQKGADHASIKVNVGGTCRTNGLLAVASTSD
jgi:hypothetical protein